MAVERSSLYVGVAGETGASSAPQAGLYRSTDGGSSWQPIGEGIAGAPQVRAIAVDPRRPGRVVIGTENGIHRSVDGGEHWTRLDAPAPGLAVWSLLVHPHDPDTILAGYEPCAIMQTTDGGSSWRALPVEVTFPAITREPHPQPKRATGIAVDPSRPADFYASVEVGGLLRSLDAGRSWACVTDGLYTVDDAVDLHGVAVSPTSPGVVTVIGRIGAFRSLDHGVHWAHLAVPPLTARGTYCRDLVVAPDDPDTLYLAGGTDFDGDEGAVFQSADDGKSWRRLDLGTTPKSALFAFVADPKRPQALYCASKGGEVFSSADRGRTWQAHALPAGATPVYALAVG